MVKVLRPKNYDEIIYVGNYFRMGIAVVMDLTGLADADARPLVDFAAGLVCGRGGAMDRVTDKIFLIQP